MKLTSPPLRSQLTQLEHVLKRPDTYIGSVEPVTQPMWVYDQEMEKMVYRCVPSLRLKRVGAEI